MAPHEQRVIAERDELIRKLVKLKDFLATDACLALPFDARCLLARQADVMGEYANILDARVDRFPDQG